MIFLPKRRLVLLWATRRGYLVESSNDAIEVKQAFISHCSSFDTIARTEYSLKLFLSIFNLLNEHYKHFNDAKLWLVQSRHNLLKYHVRVEMASDSFTRIYRSILAEQISSKIEIWRAN